MSYYIIIRGSLGIGKSTIAQALAKILGAEYISLDKVLEENELDKIVGECIPSKNFVRANEIILSKVKEELKKSRIVIFDGCFYHKEQIEHLEKNLPVKGYIFSLKASVKTCIERDSKRKRVYGEGAAKAVHKLVSKVDCGIGIDTENKSEEEVVNEILAYLPRK